jgi:predicted transcriptional regulator
LPENPRKRRDRLYIIAEILNVAREGSLKTQIMYSANLSFAQLNEYLSFLLKINLLKANTTDEERTVYKTTPKGLKFLQNYEEIAQLLRKEGRNPVKINSPVFWLKGRS